jgi:hypothetical protein
MKPRREALGALGVEGAAARCLWPEKRNLTFEMRSCCRLPC